MRQVILRLAVGLLLATSCGSGDDTAADDPADEAQVSDDEASEPDEVTEPEPEPVPESTVEPEPDVDETVRQEYVDAVVDNLEGSPPGMFDIECMSNRIVDAVTVDALVAAAVIPGEFGEAESMAVLGLEISPELRDGVTEAFEECFDGAFFANDVLIGLGLGFPDEVVSCIADSMDDFITTAIANEFVDGTGEFGPESFADAAQIGQQCAAELAADAPGSAVAWSEGEDAFAAAYVLRTTTPIFDGAPVPTVDEAECFVGSIVEILGPTLSSVPDITVGDVALYLGGAATPAGIGIVVDEPTALALAEASFGCIDPVRAASDAAVQGMRTFVDVDDATAAALEACFRDSVTDATWIETLRVQYLYGSDMYERPEVIETLNTMSAVGEFCATVAMGGG